jgi:hypothetical protein
LAALPAVEPARLWSDALRASELGEEAVKVSCRHGAGRRRCSITSKIARVLEYARALDVEADYLTELVEAASGHMAWVVARHDRTQLRQRAQPSSRGLDPAAWIMPYGGAKADPELSRALRGAGQAAASTFGKAYWDFDKTNGYAFPAIRRRSTQASPRRTIPPT